MPKVGIPRLEAKSFAGWTFVIVAGLLLALVAIVDSGGFSRTAPVADGSTGCRLLVNAEQLNVRAGPGPDTELLRTVYRGDVVDGTRTVTNLYRQLEDGSWAATEFLTPEPGSTCS